MVQNNPQVYALLQGHISEHISFKARAQVLTMIMNEMPEVAEMQQTNPDQFVVVSESLVAERVQALTEELVEAEQGNQQQDPIVQMAQKELQIKEMQAQAKTQLDQAKMQLEMAKAQSKADFDRQKLDQQAEIEKAKLAVKIAEDNVREQLESRRIASKDQIDGFKIGREIVDSMTDTKI
jgi:hypothetical protein